MSDIVILHAPSPLGLEPPAEGHVPGTWKAPVALERLGLHARLDAPLIGEVRPPSYVFGRDPETMLRNVEGIAAYTAELAARVTPLLPGPAFPLILGGDCSIALGVARALSVSGRRFGLVYIDAHSDCQTPQMSATGGVAGMPLAMITGSTPNAASMSSAARRDIDAADVVLIGVRDLFDVETENGGKRVVNTGIRVRDLDEIRHAGAVITARNALADLDRCDALWMHLDVDVLDPAIMPAVDSPDPGGLTETELHELLVALLSSPKLVGMHVTIYDPEKDPGGEAGRLLVRILSSVLTRISGRTLHA